MVLSVRMPGDYGALALISPAAARLAQLWSLAKPFVTRGASCKSSNAGLPRPKRGQCSEPAPFGSPVLAKVVQYPRIIAWNRIVATTNALSGLKDVELRLANAAAYLEAFGHVDFYRGKLAARNYFFGWELPRVGGWFSVLNPVERTPLDTPDEWLVSPVCGARVGRGSDE